MFNAGSISPQEIVLTVLYSLAGVGIAIVNDFKSVEGKACVARLVLLGLWCPAVVPPHKSRHEAATKLPRKATSTTAQSVSCV